MHLLSLNFVFDFKEGYSLSENYQRFVTKIIICFMIIKGCYRKTYIYL